MASELDDRQWLAVTEGRVTGPAGVTYERRSARLARRRAGDLVSAGCPMLVYLWSYGQLNWHDGGAEAQAAWASRRSAVTDQEPRPKQGSAPVWTAGRWESADGDVLLVLTGRC